jgi:hypothetical protein
VENSWLVPVLICASIAGSYMFSTWVRARNGYPLENDDGSIVHKTTLEDGRKIELLTKENEMLVGRIGRLEERIAVLERIATDVPTRLSAEIDNLK